MANYTQLLKLISDNIKANGNQEITGQLLGGILQVMVTELGEGYQFMGIATPDANPGTPDGNVFYIAVEPGVYANFGGIKVSDGVTIIQNKNGRWESVLTNIALASDVAKLKNDKQDKLTFDSTPAVGSQNPVTSDGVRRALDAQKTQVDAARDEALEAIDQNEQEAILNFNLQRVTPEMLSESTKQLIESSGGGTITNLADDEDIQSKKNDLGVSVLKFADRRHDAVNFSGKGYKILRKNIQDGKNLLTQEMINEANTIYEVRYDFDLSGEEITIPEGCVLKFEGGSLKNGVINGNNTDIKSEPLYIFKNIVFNGTWNLRYSFCEWFGGKGDGNTDDTNSINNSIEYFNTVYFLNKTYSISNSILTKNDTIIKGTKNTIIYCSDGNYKVFKLATRTTVECLSIHVSRYNPQTVFYLDAEHISDNGKGRGDCYINNIYIASDIVSSDVGNNSNNCIEIISNGLGGGIWKPRFTNITISALYEYAIYIDTGTVANAPNLGWATDLVFDNITIDYCINGIYIGKNDEKTTSIIPPQRITFNSCSMQASSGLNQRFAVLDACELVTFNNCQPWDWNGSLLKPIIMNPNRVSDININNTIKASSGIDFSEPIKQGRTYPYVITGVNSFNGGLNTLPFSEERITNGNPITIGEVNLLSSGIYVLELTSKLNDFLNVPYGYSVGSGNCFLRVSRIEACVLLELFSTNSVHENLDQLQCFAYNIIYCRDNTSSNTIKNWNVGGSNILEYPSIEDFMIRYRYLYLGAIDNKLVWRGRYDAIAFDALGYTFSKNYGDSSTIPNVSLSFNVGKPFYRTDVNKISYWRSSDKWLDAMGNPIDAKESGIFSNKPTNVKVGFAYFCTDRQTSEGSTNGIMIYYKGDNVWVDALGRVIS